jgi:hypothetical protein
MYQLYVRDENLNRVEPIDDYTRFDFIPRFNQPGSWVLELPTNTPAAKELIKPKSGVIVKKGKKTIFSGPVTSPKRKFDTESDNLTVSGSCDMIHIFRSLLYPASSGHPYDVAYDVRTGNAESIMKAYLNDNIGANANPERKVPFLNTEVEKGLGKKVTGRMRFHNMVEKFAELALVGGSLGFRVVQVGKELQFQVYQPEDKTRTILFSPMLGNLLDFEYSTEAPEANYVIVGGGGEGADRLLLEKGDSASIAKYGRIESFIDRRDTTEIPELQQALDEELLDKGEKSGLSISPIDTEGMTFGKDYVLGDKVSVVLTQPNEVVEIETLHYFLSAFQSGSTTTRRAFEIQEKLQVITDVIREVNISITPEGATVSPIVGTSESLAHPIFGIFDKMKKIRKRVNRLERR